MKDFLFWFLLPFQIFFGIFLFILFIPNLLGLIWNLIASGLAMYYAWIMIAIELYKKLFT